MFRDRGFAAVSMIELAQAVGLSKPGLYHHWPSKDAILHTIVRLSGEILLDHLDRVEQQSAEPRERLRLYVISRLETVARHQDLFTVTWQERAIIGSGAFEELTRAAERYRQRVRDLIDHAKHAGGIKPEINTHLLMLALDGMTGWSYFWYRPDGNHNAAEIGDTFWNMLSQGVVPASV
ncbi:TetR/AcrR family transcriptional regulator [Paracoccus onubensis]|uniref:TetR/AcrR family transcriptional regulator n=2 Tax=Paracoccus onubensis TaxID=1675788 RepID=A0A418SY07_9RHOB|nr:TetR/AcrR family transcriptional regulator [Paracoccus onubensis]